MKIKRILPKFISALLVVVMIATCAPVMGFAKDDSNSVSKVTYIANIVSGVKICFSAIDGADSYIIYRSTGDDDFVEIGSTKSTTYIDGTVENGMMYTYYAVACGNTTLLGASDEKLSKSIMYVETPVFTVENTDIGPMININPVEGASSYEVKRCDEGESLYTKIGTVSNEMPEPYFTDINAENGKSYKYSVAAVMYSGHSYYYSSQIVVEIAEVMSDDNATDITYIANKKEGVKLCFKPVDGAESYTLYRMSENESYKAIAVTDSTTYVDTDVKNNVLYTYRVAVTGYYFSENSRQIRFMSVPEFTVANAGTCVSVDFTPVEGADYYEIKRHDTTTSIFTKIGTVSADEESVFYDQNVENDTTYVYCVVAVTGKYFSYYNGVNFTTFLTPNVVLSNVQTGMKIAYKKCEGAIRYSFYRRTADSDWELISSIKPASYFYIIDNTAVSGTEYYYAVKVDTADNSTGHDPYGSNLKYLESPTVFLSNDETSVTVDFTSSLGALGYKIYRKANNSGSLKYIGSTDADTFTFVDTNVVEGDTYTYAVRALGENTMSYYSSKSITVAVISFDDNVFSDDIIVDDVVIGEDIILEDVIADDIIVDEAPVAFAEDATTTSTATATLTDKDAATVGKEIISVADTAATTTSSIIDLFENLVKKLPIENNDVFAKILEIFNAFVSIISQVLTLVK